SGRSKGCGGAGGGRGWGESPTRCGPGYSPVQRIVCDRRGKQEGLADGQASMQGGNAHSNVRLAKCGDGREQKDSQSNEGLRGAEAKTRLRRSCFANHRLKLDA